jgi:hypothetical protein
MTETVRPPGDASAHIADTTDAHDASAISFVPAGSISSTDVQAAIEEVAAEATGGSSPFELVGAPIWRFITGSSIIRSNDETSSLELDTDQAVLSGDTSVRLFGGSASQYLEAGKIWLYSDFGIVVPLESSEPAGGDSEDGQLYYNDTTKRYRVYQNGAWVDLVRGALASRTSAVAIANTETVVTNFSMPAGFMEAGTTFRIKAFGRLTSGATPGSSIFRCRIGTTTLTGNIPATLTLVNGTLVTAQPFTVEILVTVRTNGGSGTAIGNVEVMGGTVGAFTVAGAISAISATVTVDTTATKLVEFTYISGNAGTTATFENVVLELLQ